MVIKNDMNHGFINPMYDADAIVNTYENPNTNPNHNENGYDIVTEFNSLLYDNQNMIETYNNKYLFLFSLLLCMPVGFYSYYLRRKAYQLYEQNKKQKAKKIAEQSYYCSIFGILIGTIFIPTCIYIYLVYI